MSMLGEYMRKNTAVDTSLVEFSCFALPFCLAFIQVLLLSIVCQCTITYELDIAASLIWLTQCMKTYYGIYDIFNKTFLPIRNS